MKLEPVFNGDRTQVLSFGIVPENAEDSRILKQLSIPNLVSISAKGLRNNVFANGGLIQPSDFGPEWAAPVDLGRADSISVEAFKHAVSDVFSRISNWK